MFIILCAHVSVLVGRSKGSLQELILSFSHVCSEDQTQAWLQPVLYVIALAILGTELGAACMLNKCSTTEICPQPPFYFETGPLSYPS